MLPEYLAARCGVRFINPALSNLKGYVASKGMETELKNHVSGDVVLEADPGMLTIIFNNLLSNAVKYGKENDKIALSVRSNGNYFEFRVRNSGGHIPLDMRKRIFDKFTRIIETQQRQRVKGSGLGLYNARKITELHGGDIWVENEMGVYTEFIFTIPREQKGRKNEMSPL